MVGHRQYDFNNIYQFKPNLTSLGTAIVSQQIGIWQLGGVLLCHYNSSQ